VSARVFLARRFDGEWFLVEKDGHLLALVEGSVNDFDGPRSWAPVVAHEGRWGPWARCEGPSCQLELYNAVPGASWGAKWVRSRPRGPSSVFLILEPGRFSLRFGALTAVTDLLQTTRRVGASETDEFFVKFGRNVQRSQGPIPSRSNTAFCHEISAPAPLGFQLEEKLLQGGDCGSFFADGCKPNLFPWPSTTRF